MPDLFSVVASETNSVLWRVVGGFQKIVVNQMNECGRKKMSVLDLDSPSFLGDILLHLFGPQFSLSRWWVW